MKVPPPAFPPPFRRLGLALVCLTALGSASVAQARLNIVTTTTDLASIAESVGGEHVEVTSLARGTDDPHHIRPRPAFARRLAEADVLIVVGLDLEHGWLPDLVSTAGNNRIRPGRPGRIDASRNVDVIGVAPGPVDHAHGHAHSHGAGNPHYLLDPANALIAAEAIATRLRRLDEANAEAYRKNLDAFRRELEEKMEEWQAALAPFEGSPIITYHATYDYFARRYGFSIVETLEPSPGIEPTPRHISRLIPRMRDEGVTMIWSEPVRPTRLLARLADETGAVVVQLAEFPGAVPDTERYIELIDHNVRQVVEAMGER